MYIRSTIILIMAIHVNKPSLVKCPIPTLKIKISMQIVKNYLIYQVVICILEM